MRGLGLFAGSVLGALAAPALAQSPALPDVPSFCSAATAFGQTMGSTTVAGVQNQPLGIGAFVSLPTRYAPFTSAEVVVSNHSRRINRVTASLKAASAPEAILIAEQIRAQFRRAGWIEAGGKGFPAQAFDPLGDDSADFNSERGGVANPPTGRRIEINTLGASVDISCVDLPGFAQHVKEAFGPPPVGDEKPQPPPPLPAEPMTIDCTKPLSETELSLTHDDARIVEWMGRYQAANSYFETLQEWNGQQFVKAGKWTEKQKKDFELGLLSRPELEANWAYFLTAAMRVFEHVGAMGAAAEAKNDAGVCKAFNALFADVAEHGRRTLQHTEAIDRIYRAEAAKLGVTLN